MDRKPEWTVYEFQRLGENYEYDLGYPIREVAGYEDNDDQYRIGPIALFGTLGAAMKACSLLERMDPRGYTYVPILR